MNPSPTPASGKSAAVALAEVRYSLPDMLAEIALERGASSFSTEKLDQVEIGKLFKPKAPRRVKSK